VTLYSWLAKPALFALDAERAHDLTLTALRQPVAAPLLRAAAGQRRQSRLSQQLLGLTFHNPIGLAAGLDKQGTAVAAWAALGFGFAEIGTVTPRPQPGNPKPRLFRLPDDRAIINRFGFNSEGAAAVARHLSHGTPSVLRLGVNIGKNKETPNERAAEDYLASIDALHAFADYLVVNVSSPNTAGLRSLQESASLRPLIEQVVTRLGAVSARPIPVFVKVAPDLEPAQLLQSVDAALEGGASGVIATNTTIGRTGLRTAGPVTGETGGLSGAPLRGPAQQACARLYRHLGGRVPIIGVGGIFSADDAYARIRAGASLVQVYTGLIYEGPALVAQIASGLAERLARDGFTTVKEAVGTDVR
jgi:dihydroorotate dehydrogenase